MTVYETINPKLLSWASDIDPATVRQAEKTARLPIVEGHVALMPDAHVGIGATVGSVIPTKGAVIPSAVGVDIGCGMIAAELDVTEDQLPDNLEPLLARIARAVPAGVGRGHDGKRGAAAESAGRAAGTWLAKHRPATQLSGDQADRAARQFGSLGSGNHFFELCLDERGRVWVVLHSGSRGIGNQLAQMHIAKAKRLAKDAMLSLEDLDLAWFVQGTQEFDAYVTDMLWAQDYALANRAQMMDAAIVEVLSFLGGGSVTRSVNCHHNFAQPEVHDGRELWVTRKGAIRADTGDLGVIPGSMGTRSYIVRGKGSAASWRSCSHGAGRRHSRTQARKLFSAADLTEQMKGKTWLKGRASALVDEIPMAYKDIDQVMADQSDLVEVLHTLHQVLNYKGT
jgi:tRNA-splicing ligase RtcB